MISPQFPSLLRRRANARNVSKTPYPTDDKHTISTFVDQTHIQRTRPRRKTVLFKTSLRVLILNCLSLQLRLYVKKRLCLSMGLHHCLFFTGTCKTCRAKQLPLHLSPMSNSDVLILGLKSLTPRVCLLILCNWLITFYYKPLNVGGPQGT